MEFILKEANSIISRQKEALDKLKEGNNFKEKVRELEKQHEAERKET